MPFLFALLKAASPLSSREGLICSKPEENVGRAHAIGRKLLRASKATRITKREDNLKCTLARIVRDIEDLIVVEEKRMYNGQVFICLYHAGCHQVSRADFKVDKLGAPITTPN